MGKIASYTNYIPFFEVDGFYLDDGGNAIPTWQPAKKRWGNVKSILSTETEKNGAETATVKVRVALRYTTAVNHTMCFAVNGVVYDVLSIGDPVGNRKETIIIGEAKADGGRN